MRTSAVRAFLGLLTAAMLAATATPALAHHGWSGYDNSRPVTLAGTVTAVSYTYPHATIMLDVSGKTWLAVLAPPSRMSARGIGSGDIKVGAQATVQGYPSREEAPEMRAERITLDGKVYELR
jgi:hypothetical protein